VTPPPPDKTQEANINIIVVKLGTPNWLRKLQTELSLEF
jgi:hypothetical protein